MRSGGGVCGGGVSGGGGGDQMTSGGEGGARGGGAPGEGSAGEGGGSGGSTITSGGSGGGGGGGADGGGGGVGGEGGEISSSHRVPLKPSLQLHAPVPSFPSLQKVLGPVLATVPSGSQSHWRQSGAASVVAGRAFEAVRTHDGLRPAHALSPSAGFPAVAAALPVRAVRVIPARLHVRLVRAVGLAVRRDAGN